VSGKSLAHATDLRADPSPRKQPPQGAAGPVSAAQRVSGSAREKAGHWRRRSASGEAGRAAGGRRAAAGEGKAADAAAALALRREGDTPLSQSHRSAVTSTKAGSRGKR